jgi:hypothetical protein
MRLTFLTVSSRFPAYEHARIFGMANIKVIKFIQNQYNSVTFYKENIVHIRMRTIKIL